jgi:hypothetical protein
MPIGLFTYPLELHESLCEQIDDEKWMMNEYHMQYQQYGYQHDYNTGMVGEECNPIPDFLLALKQELTTMCSKEGSYFNQCIINEVMPHHTIVHHAESANYGEIVCHVTLGTGGMMWFEEIDGGDTEHVYLAPHTVAIIMNEARWEWNRGSLEAEYDVVEEVHIPRGRRIHITFRHVIESVVN